MSIARPSPEDLRARIRASGLRSTAPRLAVLQRLEEAGGPRSHAELCSLLAPQGFDRATVYRNLIDLTEAGLVSRADLGDHIWRFEARRPSSRGSHAHGREHPHFVCTDCGSVACLDDVRVDVKGARRQALGHISEVLLKGRCRACA